jgi:hypothetical protein
LPLTDGRIHVARRRCKCMIVTTVTIIVTMIVTVIVTMIVTMTVVAMIVIVGEM